MGGWTIAAFAAFGGVFVIVAMVKMFRMSDVRAHGRRVPGRVVRFEDQSTDGPAVPVVEYQIGGGTYETRGWGSASSYRIGDSVTVYYYPGEHEHGRLVSGAEWFAAWMFVVVGLIFLLVAVVMAVVS